MLMETNLREMKEIQEIASYLREMKFAKKLMGYSRESVLDHISVVAEKYEALLRKVLEEKAEQEQRIADMEKLHQADSHVMEQQRFELNRAKNVEKEFQNRIDQLVSVIDEIVELRKGIEQQLRQQANKIVEEAQREAFEQRETAKQEAERIKQIAFEDTLKIRNEAETMEKKCNALKAEIVQLEQEKELRNDQLQQMNYRLREQLKQVLSAIEGINDEHPKRVIDLDIPYAKTE